MVAMLLEEQLREEEDYQAAQNLQLEFSLADSMSTRPSSSDVQVEDLDLACSLRQQLDAINSTLSRKAIPQIAQAEHHSPATIFAPRTSPVPSPRA